MLKVISYLFICLLGSNYFMAVVYIRPLLLYDKHSCFITKEKKRPNDTAKSNDHCLSPDINDMCIKNA